MLHDFRTATTEQALDAHNAQPLLPTMGDGTLASETDGGDVARVLSVDEVSSKSGPHRTYRKFSRVGAQHAWSTSANCTHAHMKE
jgi:hypothetical protein